MQNIVLINNTRTVWPIRILMPFLSFSDISHLLILFFKEGGDNFEIAHRTCAILV